MDTTLYEEWLLGKGLEDSTILNYRGKLDRAHALAASQGWELAQPSASQLRWLSEQWPQTRSTLGQLKAALIHYYDSVEVSAPVGAIRLPKRGGIDEYKGLEDEEATRIEEAALDRSPDGLAVLCGLYLGLRRSEMVGMRWDDFDSEFDWIDVLGKGRKRRWLPVHPLLRSQFRPVDEWVFPGRLTGHAHAGSVYLWVGRLAEEVGIPEGRRQPHALRHTCLTRLYEQTGDVRLVQEFAGHSDPATTAKYTRVTRDRLRTAVGGLRYGSKRKEAA